VSECDQGILLRDLGPLGQSSHEKKHKPMYEGWNFNSGNYLFTTDTK